MEYRGVTLGEDLIGTYAAGVHTGQITRYHAKCKGQLVKGTLDEMKPKIDEILGPPPVESAYWYQKVVGGFQPIVVRSGQTEFTLRDKHGKPLSKTLWKTERGAQRACWDRNLQDFALSPDQVQSIAAAFEFDLQSKPVK